MADTVAYVHARWSRCSSTPWPTSACPAPVDCAGHPGRVDRSRRARRRARSPPSGCASAGAAPCTASPSTSTPTSRWFDHIVPCGIADKGVTSLAAEGIDVSMGRGGRRGGGPGRRRLGRERQAGLAERQDVSPGATARTAAGDDGPGAVQLGAQSVSRRIEIRQRKPGWLRAPARMGPAYLELKRTMRDLDLVTVCEEAGCPNIYDCWADGTATFMLNGDRCTRACGFCLVDTRRPEPVDPGEPERVAEAVRAAWACASRCSPRWPATTGPTGARRASWPPSRPSAGARPGVDGRGADPRLQGRSRRARARSSPPAPTC